MYNYEKVDYNIMTMIGYNTSDTVWMRMNIVNSSHSEDFQFTFNLSSDYKHEERIKSDDWVEIISSVDSDQG